MTVTSAISAILIGIVAGVVGGRLVAGVQPVGVLLAVLVGVDSAFIATAIARALGIFTATRGLDLLELLAQVGVAAAGVALVSALTVRRGDGVVGSRRSGLTR